FVRVEIEGPDVAADITAENIGRLHARFTLAAPHEQQRVACRRPRRLKIVEGALRDPLFASIGDVHREEVAYLPNLSAEHDALSVGTDRRKLFDRFVERQLR